MTDRLIERALRTGPESEQADARMRELLSRPDPGPVAEYLALLHFSGRRSGRRYTVPAGVHGIGTALMIATGSSWRHNFAGGREGELTWRGVCRPAGFLLLRDPELTARGYLELYRRYGAATAQRRLGIAVAEGSEPELDDFRDAVERCGLSLVEVTLPADRATPLRTPLSDSPPAR
ncbi:hypothetical protein P3T36_005739 [Kitasatospora sp. MAP12-15]|uniref:hypothetical protein n=1 Tax=unclassified Kitasatospora TaxID=2633591 RepID=UPI002475BD68|nr:hypothetical protein [Kitasatospora sp. MAP12-44]MDH6113749.1 hypothetical protein [Kitasatospora sp. MAP12-44]